MDSKYYRNWHLASNEVEYKVTEFEWSMLRCYEAFSRWITSASSVVIDGDIKSSEYVILQVIRMLDRPKNGATIARMINRDDIANVQYSLRKLETASLIKKVRQPGSKIHAYEVTDKGKVATDEFAKIRAELLVGNLKTLDKLEESIVSVTHFLSVVTGIYEEVSRSSAALTHTVPD